MLSKAIHHICTRAKYLTAGGTRYRLLMARVRLQERLALKLEVSSLILREQAGQLDGSSDKLLDEVFGTQRENGVRYGNSV